MSTVDVAAFDHDDENEDKFWNHGITPNQVDSLLDRPFTTLRNRSDRRASYLLIGRDFSGRCIAVPLEATHDRLIWRPVTARYCKDNEAARLPPRRS